MPTTLNVTVDVAFEDLPLLKHKLVEIDGVLTVLDQAPASGQRGSDLQKPPRCRRGSCRPLPLRG